MEVGFTGTRQGMTDRQKDTVCHLLRDLEATRFRHGDCIGADAEAHEIAVTLGIPVVVHPGLHISRAYVQGAEYVHKPKHPLERNWDIVDCSSVLIAAPSGVTEVRRSGTWSTIRKARQRHKVIAIVWPTGSVNDEG